ncbi:MAG: NUMOD4 domain-containing protein [bacterium]
MECVYSLINEKWKTILEFPLYSISNIGRIRRQTTTSNTILTPFIQYNIIKYRLKNKSWKNVYLKKLMRQYWNYIIIKDQKEWLNNIIKLNNQNYSSYKVKNPPDFYVHSKNRRNCARCGKDSGANYWCNECRIERQDTDRDSVYFPTDTYLLHFP